MTTTPVDPILVGLVSNRLDSILAETESTLIRTAFSSVLRESLDLAVAVFDSTGEMIGQSRRGTPGHINSMATGMHHIVAKFPVETLSEGDVLITNDPWMTAGQINDLTIATPIFHRGRPVAWFASCCHAPDIGGRILSANATEVYEEGVRIPIMKLRTAEGPNEVLEELLRVNVRTPDETMGDIYAQVSANEVGGRSLRRLLDEYDLDDIDAVAASIMDRSEKALREAISRLADGTYTARTTTDGFGGETLTLALTAIVRGDEIVLDYTGSSGQSRYGINVVLNYTRAYTSFAIKAALAPFVPHNAGSFRPVEVTAPPGTILNCLDPAPVADRHLVGHFLPSLVFEALRDAVPGGLQAASSDALWNTTWRGQVDSGRPFTITVMSTGGSGARPTKDGLPTTGFPSGLRGAPTEVIEQMAPIVQERRELRPDSGGAGMQRGGLGQINVFRRRGKGQWSVNSNVDRIDNPAPGAKGGLPGAAGLLTDANTGTPIVPKSLVYLDDDSRVRLDFPGGGGYGDPREREVDLVLRDVREGYVSVENARALYGVEVRATDLRLEDGTVYAQDFDVDREATAALRAASAAR